MLIIRLRMGGRLDELVVINSGHAFRLLRPEAFGEYFLEKAKRASEIQGTIRDTQKEKIRKSYLKDLDKAAKSETMQAMHYDFEMFGDKAFRKDSEE